VCRSDDWTSAPVSTKFDVGQGLNKTFSTVVSFVPELVLFLVILLIGYIVAKALAKVLGKVPERVGFDRLVERGGIKKALAQSKYDASGILSKIAFYAIMLFVLSTAFGVFGPNSISTYLIAIIAYLPLVFMAILMVVASAVITALGVVPAPGQLHIATNVVDAVLCLAAVVGIAIVAVGGAGITPMRARWEKSRASYDAGDPRTAKAWQNAPSARRPAQQVRAQTQARASSRGATHR